MSQRLHPIIRPPEEYEHPVSPVRDDRALGPTEDLDRKPDGFPHPAMAETAGFAIAISGLLLYGLVERSAAALVLCAALVPLMIFLVTREATRKRDPIHPSR
jgi:hypothetical protein